MQPIERNSLTHNLNSIKIDLKLIALGASKGDRLESKSGLQAGSKDKVHRSPKK